MALTDYCNREKFSDITIKSGHLEFKCHKIILCKASAYFEKLLDPDGNFIERTLSVIELKDDHPEAVGAMLRYIYDFDYRPKVQTKKVEDGDEYSCPAIFHLHVYDAAHKYLFPRLASKALAAVNTALEELKKRDDVATAHVFEVIKLLHEREEKPFQATSKVLIQRHMASMMKQKEFRAWLEEDDNQALDQVLDSIADCVNGRHKLRVCKCCSWTSLDSTHNLSHLCRVGNAHVDSPNRYHSVDLGYIGGNLSILDTTR
ncbi:uncharacterized protein LTR77_000034 [Saxophila tyrrhenica]|uniref:BTB domain-containing protein n=1 Tax=Saxophila tyrrhenica TaxID=1690608 RepID=A0AAV9PRA6_9PEZI|nr:hypothetical protein LTR77_000034 [Saxophila tyrrhenica]